jgi:hypothetical protein
MIGHQYPIGRSDISNLDLLGGVVTSLPPGDNQKYRNGDRNNRRLDLQECCAIKPE